MQGNETMVIGDSLEYNATYQLFGGSHEGAWCEVIRTMVTRSQYQMDSRPSGQETQGVFCVENFRGEF